MISRRQIYREMKRKATKLINVGRIPIGGGAPVSVQSMTNTDTRDVSATVGQIEALAQEGVDIVRLAVPDADSTIAFADIKSALREREIEIPIVADIHFDYRLAISAIENGADKIRINPGNVGGEDRILEIVRCAKDAEIPIRVGVNGGSLEKEILSRYGGATPQALAESAMKSVDSVTAFGFEDIVVSVKSSDVAVCIDTMRIISGKMDFPLHLGVTEAGSGMRAMAKSAIGIGALLAEGIGDTVRVSITGNPVREVGAAYDILAAAGMLPGAIDVISCPTCGRCKVDLQGITSQVKSAIADFERGRIMSARKALFNMRAHMESAGAEPIVVAVMGCAVNGPGEASHADIGVACGEGKGVLFSAGEKVGAVDESEIVGALLEKLSGMKNIHFK